jgi:L-rhamnose mutarotase
MMEEKKGSTSAAVGSPWPDLLSAIHQRLIKDYALYGSSDKGL